MKQEEVIIGVILIVVGTVLFFMGQSMNDPFSNRGNIFILFGVILLITGLIVSIIGATSTEIKKTNLYNKQVTMKHEIPPKIIVQKPQDEAFNILRTRYAKGEVTKEQYEQMKKDLS